MQLHDSSGGEVYLTSDPREIEALVEDWEALIARLRAGIAGPDVTTSHAWVQALIESRQPEIQASVLSIRDAGRLVAVAALHRHRTSLRKIPCRRLELVNELYVGRSSLLIDPPGEAALERFLRALRVAAAPWDAFVFTLVDGSAMFHAFEGLMVRGVLRAIEIGQHASPYIEFPESYDAYFGALPKKFRWLIRNSMARLEHEGELTYREFRSAETFDEYFEHMLEVERASWKEAAGSSISTNAHQERFYRAFLRTMAERNRLSAHLLYVDDAPVAHLSGIVDAGVFYDLKESYRQEFRDFSPGHVLKHLAFPSLFERRVGLYDFQGNCEPYKLKWTESTYTLRRFAVLGSTVRGRATYAVEQALHALRLHRGAGAGAHDPLSD